MLACACGDGSAGSATAGSATAGSASGSTSADATTDASASGTTGAPATTPSTSPSITDGSTGAPGGGTGLGEDAKCDVFAQDCAAGLKCVYWCGNGPCLPTCRVVTGDRTTGDACVFFGAEGDVYDDCDAASVCWTGEFAAGEGVCVPFCGGTLAQPTCSDPERVCIALAGCLERCDPLLQTCPDGQGCYDADLDAFVCWDAPETPPTAGEPCQGNTLCAPGSTCSPGAKVPGCAANRCCAPFCDLDAAPDPCEAIGPQWTCVGYGSAQPDLANLGVCQLAP